MTKVTVSEVITHPVHGDMTVTSVSPESYQEYIPAEGEFVTGYQIEAVFDKFIPVVRWNTTDKGGKRVSMLRFHSWYLRNLKRKG